MEHECPRCGYATDVKANFVKHLTQRKTICPCTKADVSLDTLIMEYTLDDFAKMYKCDYCEKQFNSRSGLSYHRKHHCNNERLQQEQLEQLEATVSRLSDQLAVHASILNSNSRNNTNTMDINNSTIRPFGQERTDHITQDMREKCFNWGVHGLKHMLDCIFFNIDIPENQNVKLRSMKHSIIDVFYERGWKAEDFKTTVDKMISVSRNQIMMNIDYTELSKNIDMLTMANNLMNLSHKNIMTIRNHTRAQLVSRRDGSER